MSALLSNAKVLLKPLHHLNRGKREIVWTYEHLQYEFKENQAKGISPPVARATGSADHRTKDCQGLIIILHY